MGAPTPVSKLDYVHHGTCKARIQVDWTSANAADLSRATIIDLSSILREGRVLDSNSQLSGGRAPLAIKILKIKGQSAGDIQTQLFFAGVGGTGNGGDTLIQTWEQNADAYMPLDLDYRESRDGGLKGPTSELIQNDQAWTAGTNVTESQDSTIKADTPTGETNSHSEKLAIAAGFTTGIVGYDNFTSADLSDYDGVGFFIRSSVLLQPGDLQFCVDDTNAIASPLETLDIPVALKANEWAWVELDFLDPSLLTAVLSHGLKATRDFGAANIYIDRPRYGKRARHQGSGTVGDMIATTSGAADGDFLTLEVEFELVWSKDSLR